MELFDGFLGGVLAANGDPRTLEQQLMPRAAFMRTDVVRKSQLLRFDPTKSFLGVVADQAGSAGEMGMDILAGQMRANNAAVVYRGLRIFPYVFNLVGEQFWFGRIYISELQGRKHHAMDKSTNGRLFCHLSQRCRFTQCVKDGDSSNGKS